LEKRAIHCLVVGIATLLTAGLVGCRDMGPNAPNDAASVTIPPTNAFVLHRHAERMATAWRTRYLVPGQAAPRGTRWITTPPGDASPVPIPGGIFPGAHVWVPGPVELGFQGVDIEPQVITDFHGDVGMAYMLGVATGSDGNTYDLFTDMRVYAGNYISVDGRHRRGTFGFV
jgi:hypothetical protein